MNDIINMRKALKLSQTGLARLLQVDRTMVSKIESGERMPGDKQEAYLSQAIRLFWTLEPVELSPETKPNVGMINQRIKQLGIDKAKLEKSIQKLSSDYLAAVKKKNWVLLLKGEADPGQRNLESFINRIEQTADYEIAKARPDNLAFLKARLSLLEQEIAFWQELLT